MTILSPTDLQFRYVDSGIPQDDPRRSGADADTPLNLRERDEVLDFVNRFCTSSTKPNGTPFGKLEALKTERLLRKYLPSDRRTQAQVADWLRTHW